MIVSKCCSAPLDPTWPNNKVCNDCKEHCDTYDDSLCAECGGEEIGFGPDSDLCSACDNENRNLAMEGMDQYADSE